MTPPEKRSPLLRRSNGVENAVRASPAMRSASLCCRQHHPRRPTRSLPPSARCRPFPTSLPSARPVDGSGIRTLLFSLAQHLPYTRYLPPPFPVQSRPPRPDPSSTPSRIIVSRP
ncbi:hypothetical protein BC834DRAFT_260718 [Gloeopeniophorella convolvens]|nr:hypothetical protein BC834DRAFT_260718 [Gloeopeniophorella convolvens]